MRSTSRFGSTCTSRTSASDPLLNRPSHVEHAPDGFHSVRDHSGSDGRSRDEVRHVERAGVVVDFRGHSRLDESASVVQALVARYLRRILFDRDGDVVDGQLGFVTRTAAGGRSGVVRAHAPTQGPTGQSWGGRSLPRPFQDRERSPLRCGLHVGRQVAMTLATSPVRI